LSNQESSKISKARLVDWGKKWVNLAIQAEGPQRSIVVNMASLAMFVLVLLVILALAGPSAYMLTRYKPKSIILKIAKRVLQTILLIAATLVSPVFLFSSMPILLRLAGLIVLILVFVTIKKEYFPWFSLTRKIISLRNKSHNMDR
jgi:hypothetical protein